MNSRCMCVFLALEIQCLIKRRSIYIEVQTSERGIVDRVFVSRCEINSYNEFRNTNLNIRNYALSFVSIEINNYMRKKRRRSSWTKNRCFSFFLESFAFTVKKTPQTLIKEWIIFFLVRTFSNLHFYSFSTLFKLLFKKKTKDQTTTSLNSETTASLNLLKKIHLFKIPETSLWISHCFNSNVEVKTSNFTNISNFQP